MSLDTIDKFQSEELMFECPLCAMIIVYKCNCCRIEHLFVQVRYLFDTSLS